MKALSSQLKLLSISRRFIYIRRRMIVSVEIFIRSTNSFNTFVLWCIWVNTCDVHRNKKFSVFDLCLFNKKCKVGSIFNVWLLWIWYWLWQYTCTCINKTEFVASRSTAFTPYWMAFPSTAEFNVVLPQNLPLTEPM